MTQLCGENKFVKKLPQEKQSQKRHTIRVTSFVLYRFHGYNIKIYFSIIERTSAL